MIQLIKALTTSYSLPCLVSRMSLLQYTGIGFTKHQGTKILRDYFVTVLVSKHCPEIESECILLGFLYKVKLLLINPTAVDQGLHIHKSMVI